MAGLRRHVPELALDWVLDAPDRRWRAIDGTLCFADISGFTALSERLAQRGRVGGEELVETLGRIFGAMLDCAGERGGTLLKFGGDALLLFFQGAQHALRAAGSAVAMQKALREAARMPTSVGPLRLTMSVGLHSGECHFFLVGAAHRELVVLGPAATTAVEIESAANAREIAVSAAAAARLPASAVRPRSDGTLLLRWRTAPESPHGCAEREVDEALVRGLFPRGLGEHLAPGAPEPEHRVACIAFVRFSGTDGMLAAEGPDAVARALDATLGTIQECFEREGVTWLAVDIDRDGGKVFAASGVPQASEDDEGAMLRALRRVVEIGTPLPLQMGVNRGHVFAAEVGGPRRAAYSAMGDTTNTAARIAAKAPAGKLYAHPSVLDQSRTLFDAQPMGPFSFKGKRAPQVVYDVGEERGTRSREGVAAFDFVGREAELASLRERIEAASRGAGSVVSIVAQSGLGKSRLLREALASLDPGSVLALRAEPFGASSPYRMLRDPVRALLGIERSDPVTMGRALQEGVERADAALLPWMALLGDVVQVETAPSPEIEALEPRFRPERTTDALAQLLEARHPKSLVITVEDAQWADQASSELLGRLARACAARPWLMLVARRETDGGFAPPAATELRLAPLGPAQIEALVIAATEAAPLRPHEFELLVQRASGNPLFVEEILRAAREVGSLEAVPDSLEAALAAQVDALDPEARRVLRMASVLGRSFARRTLAELLGVESALAEASLARLSDFLEPDGDARLRFRSGLLRDTIYGGIAFRSRTQLHRAAGETLERLSEDPNAGADPLAVHFSLAGDHPRTWRYARAAAGRAQRAYANADAARLYELALEAAARLEELPTGEVAEAWTELSDVRELAGLFDGSLDACRRAARWVGDAPPARAELLLREARAQERAGKFPTALRTLSRARRLLDGLESAPAARIRAQLMSFTAMVRFAQEQHRLALREARAAIAEARRVGEQLALGRALVVEGLARLALAAGPTDEGLREALAIFEQLGDLRMQANVRGNLGVLGAQVGRWSESLEWLRSAQAAYRRSGDAVGAAFVALNLGEMLVKQRRFDEAVPVLANAIRVMRASGLEEGAATAEIQTARVLIERGQLDQAHAELERTRALFRQLGQRASALEAAVVQAAGLVRRGDPESALALVDRAAAEAGADGRLLGAVVSGARAGALTALDRLDDAEHEVTRGLASAERLGLPYERAMLLQVKREIARRRGRAPDPEDVAAEEKLLLELGVRTPPA